MNKLVKNDDHDRYVAAEFWALTVFVGGALLYGIASAIALMF